MSNINSNNELGHEFAIVNNQGHWLSDEERKFLEQREAIRFILVVLTGICVLLPPLCPFALGLTLFYLSQKYKRHWSRLNRCFSSEFFAFDHRPNFFFCGA
tara:strand:- start:1083 stop:1385 length:303 start_codon:yes stop_codon:yes gene_type:complete